MRRNLYVIFFINPLRKLIPESNRDQVFLTFVICEKPIYPEDKTKKKTEEKKRTFIVEEGEEKLDPNGARNQ